MVEEQENDVNKVWTKQDDAFIREWASKISLQRLAVRMKRTSVSVNHRAKALDVQTFKVSRLTLAERQGF